MKWYRGEGSGKVEVEAVREGKGREGKKTNEKHRGERMRGDKRKGVNNEVVEFSAGGMSDRCHRYMHMIVYTVMSTNANARTHGYVQTHKHVRTYY